MKKLGAILFLAGLVSAAVAQTNAPNVRSLSLQDCIEEALRHNLDVQIQRYQPEISLYGLYQAYAGYDPSFTASGLHTYNVQGQQLQNGLTRPGSVTDENQFNTGLQGTLPWGLGYNFNGNVHQFYGMNNPGTTNAFPIDSSGGSIGVNLTQPLLKDFWIDNTRLQIVAAKNTLKQSEQGLRLQLITSITAVENAYYELIYARENLQVQQEALNLGQTQLDQDKQRVQVGSLAPLDVQQDEANVAQDRANLIGAQYTLEQDENTLKNLLADTNYLTWHDVDIQPSSTLEAVRQLFDVQDSWGKGMVSRPDLIQARLTMEQQGIQLKFDRNQLFPELDLVGSFGYNGAGKAYSDAIGQVNEGSAPFYTYGANLTVPLSNAKERNAYKADKAVEAQDLLKLKQLEQNIMVQIDNAVKNGESTWQSVDATKEARVYAEAALDAEQKKYAVGKSTTFTVLQLQNNLTSARSAEIRALANYQEALTTLAQQEGSTLERRNVDVMIK